MKNSITVLMLGLVFILISCNPDDDSKITDLCNPDFDQSDMFSHLAENTIIPGYQGLALNIETLVEATESFRSNPSLASLVDLRTSYTEAYKQWQRVAQFEFGPAKEVFLRNSLNNFPLNESDLLQNVQTGNYNFNMPDNYDKGFPALDYLLYGIADNEEDIVMAFLLGPNADNFSQYLFDVVTDMQSRVNQTIQNWEADYKVAFVNNTGTAAGTALSLIINGFNENYELIKREKLGIPSGALTINIPNPDRVEAYHSGLSSELLKISLQATIDLFEGVGINKITGASLDQYLDAANASKGDESLSTLISNQFEVAKSSIALFNHPLDIEIENDSDRVINAYNEISRQLVNIKTDLPSMLCVSITYIDNPSDSD